MNLRTTLALSAIGLLCMASSAAIAQNAPPTYQADPSVYKIIFEDQNFRVIAATWKAGATDKPHSHPVPSVVYSVTDCAFKLTSADGKTINRNPKAGTVRAVPITASHTATNVGPTDCQAVFVGRK
jgi:hypothetical protein